ncbi:MAG: hypothetical protein ACJA0I_000388 [Gammaproteobacteria bacterium]|jgi:hypothetical protein
MKNYILSISINTIVHKMRVRLFFDISLICVAPRLSSKSARIKSHYWIAQLKKPLIFRGIFGLQPSMVTLFPLTISD